MHGLEEGRSTYLIALLNVRGPLFDERVQQILVRGFPNFAAQQLFKLFNASFGRDIIY